MGGDDWMAPYEPIGGSINPIDDPAHELKPGDVITFAATLRGPIDAEDAEGTPPGMAEERASSFWWIAALCVVFFLAGLGWSVVATSHEDTALMGGGGRYTDVAARDEAWKSLQHAIDDNQVVINGLISSLEISTANLVRENAESTQLRKDCETVLRRRKRELEDARQAGIEEGFKYGFEERENEPNLTLRQLPPQQLQKGADRQ